MKKLLLLLAALSIQTTAAAQTGQQKLPSDLSYTFAELRFVDPDTLKVSHQVTVSSNGTPINYLNELEYINGEVWAKPVLKHSHLERYQ